MDNDTRFTLADLYRQMSVIAALAAEAHATATALQDTITETSPEIATAFHKHNHSGPVTELRLQAAHMQVSLRKVLERLDTLRT